MWNRSSHSAGFTLLEVMVVTVIIGIFSTISIIVLNSVREDAREARAQAEVKSFSSALQVYITQFGSYPPDASRDIPAGLEQYLADEGWPDGPWPDSVYDWENWNIGGEQVYQLSIRFCPIGGPLSACNFPTSEWAENFGVNSAVFYCFDGPCRSHISEAEDYPGYCLNCACKIVEDC